MNFKIFLKECSNRDVFKLLSIYVVSGWVVLQVLALSVDPLGLPAESLTVLFIILIIGFPLYIIYIWNSRLSKSWESDEDDTTEELLDKKKFRQMYFTGLGAILFLSGLSVVLIINNKFTTSLDMPKMATLDKIAVLAFDNNTGDQQRDVLGKMTADWIMHGITENDAGRVISGDVVNDYTAAIRTQNLDLSDGQILDRFLKPAKKITGSYFLNGNQLIFQSSIVDGQSNVILTSLERVTCDKDEPLSCIEELRQAIVGYLVTEKEGVLLPESSPPKYEAYKALIESQVSRNLQNSDQQLALIKKAIEVDPDFFEPKVELVAFYYNNGYEKENFEYYRKADSLIQVLSNDPTLNMISKNQSTINQRQRHIINYYKAMIAGKNKEAYINHDFEFQFRPYHLETNKAHLVLTLQFINKPERIEEIFNEVSFDDIILDDCFQCRTRLWIMAFAYNELGDHAKAVELLNPYSDTTEARYFIRQLARAYISLGQDDKVKQIITRSKGNLSFDDWIDVLDFVGGRYLLSDRPEMAQSYFQTITEQDLSSASIIYKGEAYFFMDDTQQAISIADRIINDSLTAPTLYHRAQVLKGMASVKRDDNSGLESAINALNDSRSNYQYGAIDYAIAKLYAISNQPDLMFDYLQRSISAGNFYTPRNFDEDPVFKPYLDSPEFNSIMTYWH